MTAAPMTVRICYLYPRLLSVAGDRGNLFTLMQRCAWRGIRCSVTEADVGVVPDFTQCDLILLHGGQDREMTAAALDLAEKAGPLREAIEADAAFLAVCAGYQLLGRYYTPAAGPPIAGLEVLDVVTRAGPARFIGHVAAACDLGSGRQHSLAGFENHSGRTYLGSGARPLAQVLAGVGNNGEDGTEGARYREVYATYLHGPVLPKTRGSPTTCSPGPWRTATTASARFARSRITRRLRPTLPRSAWPDARPEGGGRPWLRCPRSGAHRAQAAKPGQSLDD
jgi:lipid II isoglutaminyl synthase (glutamine-hydrolysing)